VRHPTRATGRVYNHKIFRISSPRRKPLLPARRLFNAAHRAETL